MLSMGFKKCEEWELKLIIMLVLVRLLVLCTLKKPYLFLKLEVK